MKLIRSITTLSAIALVVAACGGGSATTTIAETSTTTTTTSIAASTTAAPTTTAGPTTTTIPADTHPVFGVRWEDVWPAPDLTATYRVTTFDGDELDLPAVMEYGVEFNGQTVDRLVVGTPEAGSDGMVVYFDRSEPWDIRVVGEEVFKESRTDRAESVYVFQTPMSFDGESPVGQSEFIEGVLSLTLSTGDLLELGVTYEITVRGIEVVTVPAGEFQDVLVVDVLVGGELLGGDFTFPVELSLHAENLILRYIGASGFDQLELLEPWS